MGLMVALGIWWWYWLKIFSRV